MPESAHQQYMVREKREEVPGVTTLFLSYADGSVPDFAAGQYINVFFPECNTPEGKAYSISSAPGGSTFSITVRAIGAFSNRLCALSVGDTISASAPYGFFYPERADSELILVAAGIGITPFRSILQHAAVTTPDRKITLFHGVRSMSDAIFHDELATLQTHMPNLRIIYAISREAATTSDTVICGRMDAQAILDRIKTRPESAGSAEVLLCGSISFVRDLWKDLRDHGVAEDAMYTEAFFSH